MAYENTNKCSHSGRGSHTIPAPYDMVLATTRQMLATSWGEPEACQHAIVIATIVM